MLKESEKAYRHSQARQAGTIVEKTVIVKRRIEDYKKVCKKALDTFTIGTWPEGIDNIMFPYKWKTKLAKYEIFIKSSIDLIKVLKANCDLTISDIQEYISLILQIILLVVEDKDYQIEIATRQNLVTIGGKNVSS